MSDLNPNFEGKPLKLPEPKVSRRSFVWAAGYMAAVYGGVKWLSSRHQIDGTPWPLRRGLEFNEGFWGDAVNPDRPARTYTPDQVTETRLNETIGMVDDYDVDSWTLQVEGVFGKTDPVSLTIADIKSLPSFEMITEFCCIEGWSMIQRWKGVRLRDFMAKYPPNTISGSNPDVHGKPDDLVPYVGMSTPPTDDAPDGGYYVGLDMPSARHVQTMLCYEMNGKPLELEHGAPLRLVIPVKYGIKNIKRIGKIVYTDKKPRDYWAEQGYDWFAGL
jgi:DMSO/TMAO reductase YedYZ molybdopterin-dependent catalytic subunit